jgi:hypothetical protein
MQLDQFVEIIGDGPDHPTVDDLADTIDRAQRSLFAGREFLLAALFVTQAGRIDPVRVTGDRENGCFRLSVKHCENRLNDLSFELVLRFFIGLIEPGQKISLARSKAVDHGLSHEFVHEISLPTAWYSNPESSDREICLFSVSSTAAKAGFGKRPFPKVSKALPDVCRLLASLSSKVGKPWQHC